MDDFEEFKISVREITADEVYIYFYTTCYVSLKQSKGRNPNKCRKDNVRKNTGCTKSDTV